MAEARVRANRRDIRRGGNPLVFLHPCIAAKRPARYGSPYVRVRVRLGNDGEIGAPLSDERCRLPLIDSSDTDSSPAQNKIYAALWESPSPSPLLIVPQSSSSSMSRQSANASYSEKEQMGIEGEKEGANGEKEQMGTRDKGAKREPMGTGQILSPPKKEREPMGEPMGTGQILSPPKKDRRVATDKIYASRKH
jgi:hypothetical protein